MTKIFAIGTLKRGFAFHERGLADAPCLGRFRSLKSCPLVVAGPWFSPMLLDEPGAGLRVEGELYEVDDAGLVRLDRLESVGKPGQYRRPIEVEAIDSAVRHAAFAFMKDRALAVPLHSACLACYADRRFIPPERRALTPPPRARHP